MGGWLERLKKGKGPATDATKATETTRGDVGGVFVGFVACPTARLSEIEAHAMAANDTATADPDRWCWPYSEAMNGQEIDTFSGRLALFTDRGMSLKKAEQMADRLLIRDRESDDRRLCFECVHLHGFGRWCCGNWEAADVARDGLSPDLVHKLQRCSGYRHVTNNET